MPAAAIGTARWERAVRWHGWGALSFGAVCALSGFTAHAAEETLAPRSRTWCVYDDRTPYLRGQCLQEVTDSPGALVSNAPPPPDGSVVRHPFLGISTVVANHESELHNLLTASTCLTDYLARVRNAGFRLEPTEPDQLWQVTSGDELIAQVSDAPAILTPEIAGSLADVPLCRQYLSIAVASPEHWARIRPVLMASEDLAHFLRGLAEAGLRVESRVSPTDCEFLAERPIRFASRSATDVLRVHAGGRCDSGWLAIHIDSKGEWPHAYQYEAKLSTLTPTGADDRRGDTQRLVAEIASEGAVQSTAALPPYRPAAEYCAQHGVKPHVGKTQYEALRRARRPMFRHPTGPDTWVAVAYDPTRRRATVVLTGGGTCSGSAITR